MLIMNFTYFKLNDWAQNLYPPIEIIGWLNNGIEKTPIIAYFIGEILFEGEGDWPEVESKFLKEINNKKVPNNVVLKFNQKELTNYGFIPNFHKLFENEWNLLKKIDF